MLKVSPSTVLYISTRSIKSVVRPMDTDGETIRCIIIAMNEYDAQCEDVIFSAKRIDFRVVL